MDRQQVFAAIVGVVFLLNIDGTAFSKTVEDMATLEKEALAQLSEQNPEATKELEEAVGYAVIEMKVVKVPIFGAGTGKGVVVKKASDQRSYLNVKRLDLGAGYGGKAYKMVLIFQDQEVLQDFANGKFGIEAGAEATAKAGEAGGGSEGGSGNLKKGSSIYVLTDGGVSATATIRVMVARPWTPN